MLSIMHMELIAKMWEDACISGALSPFIFTDSEPMPEPLRILGLQIFLMKAGNLACLRYF